MVSWMKEIVDMLGGSQKLQENIQEWVRDQIDGWKKWGINHKHKIKRGKQEPVVMK